MQRRWLIALERVCATLNLPLLAPHLDGIAQYHQDESFVTWFDRADDAMYNAKKSGRNRVFLAL